MQGFLNETSLTLHITKACNLKCGHCYQHSIRGFDAGVINLDKAYEALDILKPDNVIFYGGEPMLHPEIIFDVMKNYRPKKSMIITNGSIWNESLFDEVGGISISLSSFRFDKARFFRPYTENQFRNIQRILRRYKGKLLLSHDIYPTLHDESFYRVADLSGIPVDTYPVITKSHDFRLYQSYIGRLSRRTTPLLFPKLRILEDGTITRDMRGVHNLGTAKEWHESMKKIPLPIHERCRKCSLLKDCPSCLMFPAFIFDILNENPNDDFHFCKMARALSEHRKKNEPHHL